MIIVLFNSMLNILIRNKNTKMAQKINSGSFSIFYLTKLINISYIFRFITIFNVFMIK